MAFSFIAPASPKLVARKTKKMIHHFKLHCPAIHSLPECYAQSFAELKLMNVCASDLNCRHVQSHAEHAHFDIFTFRTLLSRDKLSGVSWWLFTTSLPFYFLYSLGSVFWHCCQLWLQCSDLLEDYTSVQDAYKQLTAVSFQSTREMTLWAVTVCSVVRCSKKRLVDCRANYLLRRITYITHVKQSVALYTEKVSSNVMWSLCCGVHWELCCCDDCVF